MLFQKKTFFKGDFPASCAYCQNSRPAQDGSGAFYCPKKGIVDAAFHCRAYVYDPLQREPKRRPQMPQFDPGEFRL
ncbi:MAG TPA: hypothetical protein H9883_04710 [Candidatus Ruthenibacterium merdigallinarum]|nr:hypothetical protein [Candidatus Ruthenibacterium merdigallinarum]